jgi:hypothetical protein
MRIFQEQIMLCNFNIRHTEPECSLRVYEPLEREKL